MLADSSIPRQGGQMAPSFPFDIVGFDLDGTLVDSSLELAAALNHALAQNGRAPIPANLVKQLVGMGAKHMLKMALEQSGTLNPDELNQLLPILIAHYEHNLGTQCPIFPGLEKALDHLSAQGVRLAVVTNKYEHLAVKLLDAIGLLARFETVIGGDTLGPGRSKPKPDPIHEMITRCGGGKAAFVGDSIHDVHAAQAAGIPSVAVRFGFLHQPAEALGATAIIDHFDDLIPSLHRLT